MEPAQCTSLGQAIRRFLNIADHVIQRRLHDRRRRCRRRRGLDHSGPTNGFHRLGSFFVFCTTDQTHGKDCKGKVSHAL